jgi:hypothetical protein
MEKNVFTSSGLKLVTFWHVAQCVNHCSELKIAIHENIVFNFEFRGVCKGTNESRHGNI